ncbi:Increased DNA methylation 2 [Spatholobus suberectus]|nr:Increased DNA methylation 2 [Spatholobus suberectus]
MDLRGNLCYKRRSATVKAVISESDTKFLIDFIFTTYLGPDVKSHNPRCSVIQKLIAGSRPYILSDLGPSYVSISLLERLYYYLLKDTSPNLVLDLNMFHMYLKGKLRLPTSDFTQDSQQFTSFFPLDLHQQIWYPDSFRVIKGVVLIDDPFTSCIKEEDLNRFRSLTGVSTFKLNLSECLCFQLGHRSSKEGDGNCVNKVPETIPNGGCQSGKFQQEHKRKYINDTPPPMPEFPHVFPTKHNAKVDPSKNTCKSDGPTLMPLLSIPDIDDCNGDSSLILTGTARRGLFGPSVGVVDIGVSKVAYLFRVSLPGVKKDCSQFSCDIESNGRVQMRGVLTGGRTITKQSRVFQMKIRQLCSPGPFTLSFSLPGPVDPRLFAPNFRSDGIFEGVVIKQ